MHKVAGLRNPWNSGRPEVPQKPENHEDDDEKFEHKRFLSTISRDGLVSHGQRARSCSSSNVVHVDHFGSSARTPSIGIASATPNLDLTVVARNSELYTASSVASSAAWKRGDTASVGSDLRARGAVSPKRLRISGDVENAMAKSPLPLLNDDPVRPKPNTARAASRPRSRASSGASVATTSMHEPSPGPGADPVLGKAAEALCGGGSRRKIGTPAIVR